MTIDAESGSGAVTWRDPMAVAFEAHRRLMLRRLRRRGRGRR